MIDLKIINLTKEIMAEPTSFEESNAFLDKPNDMSYEECSALAIVRLETSDGVPFVVSCWKFTKEELYEINRTGRVWLGICGQTMPPAWISGTKPF